MLKSYPPPLITNGGFESGDLSSWQQGGELARRVVTDVVHSSRYAVLLGNPEAAPCQAPSGQAWIEQELTLPWSGTPTLSLWHRVFTYDKNVNLDDGIDHLDVLLNGRRILRVANRSQPPRCEGLPHDLEWQRFVYDLSAYRGQSVRLRIVLVSTDNWWNSWTYVDDVQVDLQ